MRSPSPSHRCSAEDSCDEATLQAYLVTDHDGVVSLVEYCDACAELAQADWNGNTAEISEPLDAATYCLGCSLVVGEPVDHANCSSLTHPMGAHA